MKKKSAKKRAKHNVKIVSAKQLSHKESTFDSESYTRWVENLTAEVSSLSRTTDALRVLKEDILSKQDRISENSFDLEAYLTSCVHLKENEYKTLTFQLKSIQDSIAVQRKAHEDLTARLLLEIDETKVRLGLEKTVLTGKLASMKDVRIQKEKMERMFVEIRRLLDETVDKNRRDYYERDLEVTLMEHRLLEEMKERVRNLTDAFYLATGARIEKAQLKTLNKNCLLKHQLSVANNQALTEMGRNKFVKMASNYLRSDVSALKEVSEQMRRKFEHQLKVMEQTIRECQEHENSLRSTYENEGVQTPYDARSPEDFPMRSKERDSEVEVCCSQAKPARDELDKLKVQCEQMNVRVRTQVARLNELRVAKHQLGEMVSEVIQSLRDAQELFHPGVPLTMSERTCRKARLLTALLVLLSTGEQFGNQIKLDRLRSSNADTLLSQSYHQPGKNMPALPNVRKQRGVNNFDRHGLINRRLPSVNLTEFRPVQRNTTRFTRVPTYLLRELSRSSRHESKSIPTVRSVSVQATPRLENVTKCYSMLKRRTRGKEQDVTVGLTKPVISPQSAPIHRFPLIRRLRPFNAERLSSLYSPVLPLSILL